MESKNASRSNPEKRSGFRSSQDKLRRHDEILAAAFEEFSAKGYAEARIEDVAQRAGIAKGTIYLHFKNKEILFRAVLRAVIHHAFEKLEDFVRTYPGPVEDLLRNVLSLQYTEIVKNPRARSMFRLLIAESHHFPQLAEVYLREVIMPGVAAMRVLVEKGISSGEFHGTKIVKFPQVLVGPAVLAVVWTLILGDREQLDLDAYMETHLELLLCGLRNTNLAAGDAFENSISQEQRS